MGRPHLTISVVMGGPSAEHDISLKSGHGIAAALRQRGYRVEDVTIPNDLTFAQATAYARLALVEGTPDVAFVALHGSFGEDGTIQRLCEELGVCYTGSDSGASALGLDKIASRRRFEHYRLQVPPWRVITPRGPMARALGELQLPVVVKPSNQGSSIGVSIVTRADELPRAIAEAGRYDSHVLLEAYIRGRELTVGIVGEEALPVIEIQPATPFFDFTAKYTPGQTIYIVPAKLPEAIAARVQTAALRAHRALGCRDFSRVDLILNQQQEPVILEVNTIPGFTATSLLPKAAACVGMSYDALCERLVQMAYARQTSGQPPAAPSTRRRATKIATPSAAKVAS